MKKWEWLLQKFTSRKFWALLGAFAVSVMVIFNIDSDRQTQIVALIGAFGSVVAYIVGEGKIDVAREENKEV